MIGAFIKLFNLLLLVVIVVAMVITGFKAMFGVS
jgi:hypothetical protein